MDTDKALCVADTILYSQHWKLAPLISVQPEPAVGLASEVAKAPNIKSLALLVLIDNGSVVPVTGKPACESHGEADVSAPVTSHTSTAVKVYVAPVSVMVNASFVRDDVNGILKTDITVAAALGSVGLETRLVQVPRALEHEIPVTVPLRANCGTQIS
jgi:hypothetical protein